LDKPTIDFAVREIEKVSNRTKYLSATVPVTQLESLSVSQKIMASNVKYRGLSVINSMKDFLSDMYEQNKLTDQILLNTSRIVENSSLSIPVIIAEINYDRFDNKKIEIDVNDLELNKLSQSAIKNAVMSIIEFLPWGKNTISKDIQSEFSKFNSLSNNSQRVKDMTNKLFMANNYQHLQNQ